MLALCLWRAMLAPWHGFVGAKQRKADAHRIGSEKRRHGLRNSSARYQPNAPAAALRQILHWQAHLEILTILRGVSSRKT